MGISNSKNFNNKFINENLNFKNIDIIENDNFILVENKPYYNISDSLDQEDIEGIFATYKVEFGTKSKTMRIIEELNKKEQFNSSIITSN